MLRVSVQHGGAPRVLEHGDGPLEFGRAPRDEPPRCVLDDPYVSRDHLRVEELPGRRLRLANLSHTADVRCSGGRVLHCGESCDAPLPSRLRIGESEIRIEALTPEAPPPPVRPPVPPEVTGAASGAASGTRPAAPRARRASAVPLADLGESPDAATLLGWLETLVRVEQAAAGSDEFLTETARALVELVGLDRGLVLLPGDRPDAWSVAARWSLQGAPRAEVEYSTRVLEEVLRGGATLVDELEPDSLLESLAGVETVVASPVADDAGGVVAVLYGTRGFGSARPGIRPLEAQVVQVLAAALGAGLARQQEEEHALRERLRFEQFFSEELARELASDPSLLDGREREVTVVFSDLRGFTRMSEELGPARTFEVMQDVMELQSDWIRRFGGVVVDYVGDGLLAMWNAPSEQPDHAELASRAVLAFLQHLPALNARWSGALSEPLQLGVAVSTGPALVGNTGSRVKMKYGPMGKTVNLASRVEEATKHLGVPVLVTGATRARLPAAFATRRLGRARLPGLSEPVELFELHGAEPDDAWSPRRDTFEEALAHFEARRLGDASRALTRLVAHAPEPYDVPSIQLLSRTVEAMKTREAEFDPVLHLE